MSQAEKWKRMVSWAEGTMRPEGIGYNIQYGGGTYDNTLPGHPNRVISGGPGALNSAAAGAYQFMPDTWDMIVNNLPHLRGKPMSPAAQDEAFQWLAGRRGVDINTAPINRENIAKLAPEWASLPTMEGTSYWGQGNKSLESLLEYSEGVQGMDGEGGPVADNPAPTLTPEQQDAYLRASQGDMAAIRLLQQSLGRDEGPITPPETKPITADPDLVKEAMTPDPEPVQTGPDPRDLRIAQLESNQDRLYRAMVKSQQAKETQKSELAMQQLIKNARDAFEPGKSVI